MNQQNQQMEVELLTEFIFESEVIMGIPDDKEEIKNHLLSDYGEFKGHVGAIFYLKQLAEDKNHLLTERDVKKVHKLIMKERLEKWPDLKFNPKAAGKYIEEIIPSDRFVMIDGRILPPRNVAEEMKALIAEINVWQKFLKFGYVYNLKKLADFHYQFGIIRPFIDGNGRTGRAINLYLFYFMDKIPFIFDKEDINLYYSSFFSRDKSLMRQYFLKKARLE